MIKHVTQVAEFVHGLGRSHEFMKVYCAQTVLLAQMLDQGALDDDVLFCLHGAACAQASLTVDGRPCPASSLDTQPVARDTQPRERDA